MRRRLRVLDALGGARLHPRCAASGGSVLASAGASGLGAWGLDLGSGHCGLSLVSRGCRYVCVGASALGNFVFRVVCMCMGVWLRHASFHSFGLVGPWVRPPVSRSCGFVLWAPGFFVVVLSGAVSCTSCSRAGLNLSLIRCTTHSQSDVPGVLVLERLRVVEGAKKKEKQKEPTAG